MDQKEAYEHELEAILAIERDRVTAPHNIPVDVYIQEAHKLYRWAQADTERLTAMGMPPELPEHLPVRAEALAEAETRWYVQKNTRGDAAALWARKFPVACELRLELIREMRFAFRKHPNLISRLKYIDSNNDYAGIIQGLLDLAHVGRSNKDLLESIRFDLSRLELADQQCSEMSTLHAKTTGQRLEASEAKDIRDRAYSHLKETVDEIYVFGRFVFRKDKERLKGYRSHYLSKKNARQYQKKISAPAPVAGEKIEGKKVGG